MNGFNVAEQGHPVILFNPSTIANGVTGQAVSLKDADHVSIGVFFGAEGGSPATAPTSIVLNACTDASGDNPVALTSFRYYYQSTSGASHDVLDGYQQQLPNSPNLPPNFTTSASGITTFPTSVTGLQFWLEVDSAELEAAVAAVGPQTEHPYLQLVIGNGNVATYAFAIAILSGLRQAGVVSPTATT